MIYRANDKYRANLRETWIADPPDGTLQVTAVPDNVPTLITVGWGGDTETVFSVEGKSGTDITNYALTGVTRIKGANENIPEGTIVNCLNHEEFFNQFIPYVDMNFRGDYDNATSYSEGDVVYYEGSSYVAKAAGTGNLPTDTDYWIMIAKLGASIKSAAFSGDDIVFTLTDESTVTLTDAALTLKGEKGDTGDTGASITSAAFVGSDIVFTKDDTSTVTLTDAVITLKGDTGDTGPTGPEGPAGADGLGVPAGGDAGQVLTKVSSADNDTEWADAGVNINKTEITSSATPTPVGSEFRNELYITALSENTTIGAPSGTPENGNVLIVRIKDNGTSRTIAWNSVYSAPYNIDLPSATVASSTAQMLFIYNSTESKWELNSLNGDISTDSGWQSVTMLNGWVDYNSGDYTNSDNSYIRKIGNVVYLRGLVKSGTVHSTNGFIFYLPEGWWPEHQHIIPVVSNNALGRLDITVDGGVRAASGSSTWFSLFGISFAI